jgi:hypothetical protein
MSKWLDRLLALLKWPVALVGLLFFPALLWALYDLLRGIGSAKPLLPFLAGFLVYFVAWFAVLSGPSFAGFFSTMEHELTHALFAWVTFHPVVGFRGTWTSGGHIRYLGRGNWLVSIGPYFVPTLSLLAALALSLLPHRYLLYGSPILGAMLAYHATTTWARSRRHQSDLREVGFFFSLFVLPSATALLYGLFLSFVVAGGHGMQHYLSQAYGHMVGFARALWSWIAG